MTQPGTPSPKFLGVEEAAAALRLSPKSVRRAVASGDLPHVQIGGKGHAIRIPREALEAQSKEASK